MNRFVYTYILVPAIVCSLTGCLPIPHTTERSREVYGRVLNASTHTPIQGAKISLTESPKVSTHTDATGCFRLRATRNFHLAYIPPEGDSPDRKDDYIEISHPYYLPYGFLAGDGGNIGDILLKPKQ